MLDLVLKGRLVLPGGSVTKGWLGIAGGRIVSLGEGEAPDAAETTDHGDALILPGAIDGQTHAGSQWGFAGIARPPGRRPSAGSRPLSTCPMTIPIRSRPWTC